MNLQEKKKNIESILNLKIRQAQDAENRKNALLTEIVEMRGKLQLIEELEKEQKGE